MRRAQLESPWQEGSLTNKKTLVIYEIHKVSAKTTVLDEKQNARAARRTVPTFNSINPPYGGTRVNSSSNIIHFRIIFIYVYVNIKKYLFLYRIIIFSSTTILIKFNNNIP